MAEGLLEETQRLQSELDSLRARYQDLRKRFVKVEKASLDERAVVKLRCLTHMYGRLLNFQAHCEEDKAKTDELVRDAQHVIQAQLQKAAQPK